MDHWLRGLTSRVTQFAFAYVFIVGVGCRADSSPAASPPSVMAASDQQRLIQSGAAARTASTGADTAWDGFGMGGLQTVALQIVRGIQDPHIRSRLAIAMRDSSNHGMGIDLTSCTGTSIAADVLQAGQRHGGGDAKFLCADLAKRGNFILYMDGTELRRWNEQTLPSVTVFAQPQLPVPPHLMAYRSPSRMIDIGNGRNIVGPMLVILPFKHPSRAGAAK
jgi:hypothetical protein